MRISEWRIRYQCWECDYVIYYRIARPSRADILRQQRAETVRKRQQRRAQLRAQAFHAEQEGWDLLAMSAIAGVLLSLPLWLWVHLLCVGVILNFVRHLTKHKWMHRLRRQKVHPTA